MLAAISAEDKESKGAAALLVPVWLSRADLELISLELVWPANIRPATANNIETLAIRSACFLNDFLLFRAFDLAAFFISEEPILGMFVFVVITLPELAGVIKLLIQLSWLFLESFRSIYRLIISCLRKKRCMNHKAI